MAEIEITQEEADRLISLDKRYVEDKDLLFPRPGERLCIPLVSLDKRESFQIDVTRASIKLTKAPYQNRPRTAIILMSLDLDGPPHRNPDGEEIPCPHLHVSKAGYGDKISLPAPVDRYPTPDDLLTTSFAFMEHCKVTEKPRIQNGLF